MKKFIISIFCLLFSSVNFAEVPDGRGMHISFSFHNLEPGRTYQVTLNGGWFSKYVGASPLDFKLTSSNSFTFKAPKDSEKGTSFSSAAFSVGSFFVIDGGVDQRMEIVMDIPQPAIASVMIPEYFVYETLQDEDPDTSNNSDRASFILKGLNDIDACIPRKLFQCSAETSQCPSPQRSHLKCYGPIQATFYCCTTDPLSKSKKK